MEDIGLRALHKRVAGIDAHRMLHVVMVLIELPQFGQSGSMQQQNREFPAHETEASYELVHDQIGAQQLKTSGSRLRVTLYKPLLVPWREPTC